MKRRAFLQGLLATSALVGLGPVARIAPELDMATDFSTDNLRVSVAERWSAGYVDVEISAEEMVNAAMRAGTSQRLVRWMTTPGPHLVEILPGQWAEISYQPEGAA